jgi:CDP-diacylglycerol---glycerol-3-phosphate 3-phosphatidyltransferase
MLSEKVGHRLDGTLSHIAQLLFGKNINPHTLTLMGLAVNMAAGVCLGTGHWKSAGALITAAGLFDLMDGAVARVLDKVTKFGGFLDSVIDRYSDIVLLMGIIWFYADRQELGYTLLACIVLMGCILIPYSRARAEAFLTRCNIGLMERAERTILLAAGSLFNVMIPVLWCLAVLTHITVFQRIHYTWKEMRKLEEQTANR